ncbi:MAG: hypothetical protein CVV17_02370, partial [Gammaproteobacteria bacterium HGW-Gammaproteobacteria-7]
GNPFVSLYLVPVSVAAATMHRRYAMIVAMLAVGLYTWLLYGHQHKMHLGGSGFATHVTGMWVQFLISAVILLVVLCRFRAIVEDQRKRLAQARERQLRDESLIAVGALAAGTAHELNTPLTTMGLLIDSLAADPSSIEPDDLELLAIQVARCREHVRTLADLARDGAMGKPRRLELAAFVRDCIGRWRLLRPGVVVRQRIADAAERAAITVDPTLPQALINLLDNAADAIEQTDNSQPIDIELDIAGGDAVLRILDRGPGPRRHVAQAEDAVRGRGLGIGMLISNASIERAGGRVSQYPRTGGGCVTEVVVPTQVST